MRASMMAALTMVLAFAAQVPLIGGLGLFLLPLPMAIVGVMHGIYPTVMGVVISALVLAVFLGPVGAAFYLPFAVTSLVVGLGLYYRLSMKWILLGGVVLIGSSAWLNTEMVASLQGIDLQTEAQNLRQGILDHYDKQFVENARAEQARIASEYEELRSGLTVGVAELEKKKRDLDHALQAESTVVQTRKSLELMLKYQVPFLLFSLFAVLVIEVSLLRLICKRVNLVDIPSIGFSTWNCPGALSWLMLGLLVISIWSKQSILLFASESWLVSLSFTVQLVYFVFGLSFMTFLMLRYQVSVPVRVILYSLSLFYGPVLVFLGIFDSLFNFRKAYFSAPQPAPCG